MKTGCDLLITLLFYAGLTGSCLGWGHYLSKCLGLNSKVLPLRLSEIWLGWCGLIFIFQIVHCIVPLNVFSSLGIYGLGYVFLFRALQLGELTIPREDLAELGRTWQIIYLMFAIWVAMQAMKTPVDYDDGLYHFSAVRWINEYSIVPGLGNIHGRLAFNYAFFPFAASLNLFPVFNHGHNVAIGWLALLTLIEFLFYFNRVLQTYGRQKVPPLSEIAPAVLLPYLLYTIGEMDLSSLQVDHVVCLTRLMLFIYLWRNLASDNPLERLESTKMAIILGVTAVTFKLSVLFYPVVIVVIAVIRSYRDEKRRLWSLVKQLFRPALFAMFILFIWMVRSYITSGYFIYPLTTFKIHSDWTIPLVVVNDMKSYIYSWARLPYHDPAIVLKSSAWIVPWLIEIWNFERVKIVIPMLISLVSFVFLITSFLVTIFHKKSFSPLYLTVLPILAGLVSWLFFAPMPRYADGLFWLLPLACLSVNFFGNGLLRRRPLGTIIILFVMSLPLLLEDNDAMSRHFTFSRTGWQPIQTAILQVKTTNQGLKLYVPVTGDQCWDAPLPNAPYFYAGLELRGAGLQSGFKSSLGLLNGGAASADVDY